MNHYSFLCYPSVLLHWLFSIDLLTPGQETSQDTSALGMSLRLHNEKSGQAGFPLQEDCRILQLVPQSQKYLRQLPHRPILPYFASPSPSFPQRLGEHLSSANFLGDEHNRNPHQSRRCEKPGASLRGAGFERRQRSKCIPWRVCVRTQRPFDLSKPFDELNFGLYPDISRLIGAIFVLVSCISYISCITSILSLRNSKEGFGGFNSPRVSL